MENEASMAELKALRAAILAGLNSGPAIPAEKVFADLRARYSQGSEPRTR